jgi:hypothetical protein
MAKKRSGDERRRSPFALALIVAGCLAIIVIGLCAPVARAELISSSLPGLLVLASAWFGQPTSGKRQARRRASRRHQ